MKVDFNITELSLLLMGIGELEKKVMQQVIDYPLDGKRQLRERLVKQLDQLSDKLAEVVNEY